MAATHEVDCEAVRIEGRLIGVPDRRARGGCSFCPLWISLGLHATSDGWL